MTNYVYEFVGGKYHGRRMIYDEVMKIYNGHFSTDYSEERKNGRLCPRKELDNQPQIDGYIGAMWDGLRYIVDGKEYYDFTFERLPKDDVQGKDIKTFVVLRYETQKVYNALSI